MADTCDPFNARMDITRHQMKERELDGLLVVSSYPEKEGNVYYLAGHRGFFPPIASDDFYCGFGYSALVVSSDGKVTLIAPLGYDRDRVCGVESVKTGTNLLAGVIESLREGSLQNAVVGVAGSDVLPWSYYESIRRAYPGIEFVPADEILEEQRRIKEPREVQLLDEAAKVGEKALRRAMQAIIPGKKEWEISADVTRYGLELGAEYVVRTRVHSGEAAGSLRWPLFSHRVIQSGDLVTVDFIGWYRGYAFDLLGTVVAGQGRDGRKRYLEVARSLTAAACDAIKPGKSVQEIIRETQLFLSSQGESRLSMSFFGHGIGIEVVESPLMHGDSNAILEAGMTLCVEPTLITPEGERMCFEDEILVTKDGRRRLTSLSSS